MGAGSRDRCLSQFGALLHLVGMAGLEPATSRTPCVHSKPSELHPDTFAVYIFYQLKSFFKSCIDLKRDLTNCIIKLKSTNYNFKSKNKQTEAVINLISSVEELSSTFPETEFDKHTRKHSIYVGKFAYLIYERLPQNFRNKIRKEEADYFGIDPTYVEMLIEKLFYLIGNFHDIGKTDPKIKPLV